jgi:hypothetical protein
MSARMLNNSRCTTKTVQMAVILQRSKQTEFLLIMPNHFTQILKLQSGFIHMPAQQTAVSERKIHQTAKYLLQLQHFGSSNTLQ